MISITLTAAQVGIAEWALDAMLDVAGSEDFDYGERDIPRVQRRTLVFPTDSVEAASDLLYRLEEQYPDVADQDGPGKRAASVAAAGRLADKIREAFAVVGRPISNDAQLRNPIDTPGFFVAVSVGLVAIWGIAQWYASRAAGAKIATALPPGSTVNPTPASALNVTPGSKQSVQLATGANVYGLLSSVALNFPSTATYTTTNEGAVTIAPTASGIEVTAASAGPALVTVSFGDPTGKTDAFVSIGVTS